MRRSLIVLAMLGFLILAVLLFQAQSPVEAQAPRTMTDPMPVLAAPARSAAPVEVVNFPTDGAGNLLVAEQTATLEVRFLEADMPGLLSPTFVLPPGFTHVSISLMMVDTTRGGNMGQACPEFGVSTAPLQQTSGGLQQPFWASGGCVGAGSARIFSISGDLLRFSFGDRTTPFPPPDSEYYVHLYLTR